MRKTRIIAILCLSLILCFLCVSTNTFSWFSRPQEGKGKSFIWSGNSYNQTSSKKFNVTTYEMTNEDGVYGTKSISEISKNIPAGKRLCYKTEIKNTGKLNAQTVSLYLSGVESSNYGNTYVGVNNPMKTYKALAPESKTKNENGMKNVYVGIYSLSTTYQPSRFKLHWWKSDNTKNGDADIEYLHSVEYKLTNNDNYHVYHAEVPWDAIGVGIKQDDVWKGENIYLADSNFVCLLLDDKGDFKQDYGRKVNETPAGIKYFYSEASINVNGKIDLTAFGNGDLVYKSDKPGIAKVVKDPDGKVYVQGVSEGDATISVTSTGTVCDNQDNRKPDTQTFTCVVHVKPVSGKLPDTPVVTNMVTYPYNEKTKENLVTVYWYIKNEGSSDITVSVDKINVTL